MRNDLEKTMESTKTEVLQQAKDDEGTMDDVSSAEKKKIIRKIDRRLITATGLMFAVSLMDRTNLGYAMIAGMGEELELTVGFRYVSPSL